MDKYNPREQQAAEAEQRRALLAAKYNVQPEEVAVYREKLKSVIEKLPADSNLEQVTESMHHVFDSKDKRQGELELLFLDSILGKISESIRHYLPAEAQENFKDILETSENQITGAARSINSFKELGEFLKSRTQILKKYGIKENYLLSEFLKELKSYLSSLQ